MGIKGSKSSIDTVEERGVWKAALGPTIALIAIGVLPGLMKGFYEPYVGKLMSAYVASGLFFITAILCGLAFMVARDLSSRKTKVFRLAPDAQPVIEEDGAVRIKSDLTE